MKKTLDYFMIDGEIGGNQEWFRNVVMNIGGCAAATACDSCIYFALRHGMGHLYPYHVQKLNKEEYIDFSMKMKPYIKPRVGGVKKLYMFIDGFAKYLEDAGDGELAMAEFPGEKPYAEAAEFIKEQIDAGFPIPYLMLRHKNTDYKDFVWHWFLCIGYELKDGEMLITVATYGEATTFSLKDLWSTGYEEKGGLIQFKWKANAKK